MDTSHLEKKEKVLREKDHFYKKNKKKQMEKYPGMISSI